VRSRSLNYFIRLGIGSSHVNGVGAGNIAMAGGAGVDLFNDEVRDGSATGGQGSVGLAHTRGTAASETVGDNLNLVGHSVLGSDVVGFGARDFAMSGLVVYFFDTSHGDGHGTVAAGKGRRVGWGVFRGIREVVVRLFWFLGPCVSWY
jgi:hypothetical protein